MVGRFIEALIDATVIGSFCFALYIGAALVSGAA
ncbi:hypothetical protein ABIA95_000209 [Bradyrhizobium sp. LA8.1]